MKLLHTLLSLIIVSKYARSHALSGDLEYTLDVVGDNNWEKIDTDFTDPKMTVFRPIGDAKIGVVKYGPDVIWKRTGKKLLQKVLVIKVGNHHKFMHLFYKEGKKNKALIMVRDGNRWKVRSIYNVKKSDESEPESTPSEPGEVEEEKVDLDISGGAGDCAKVKHYISLGVPTVEFTRFTTVTVHRVVDGFQTIWKLEDGGKQLTGVRLYDKPGFNPLLVVMMGYSVFNDGDVHFEKDGQNWKHVPRAYFYYKFKLAMYDDYEAKKETPEEDLVKSPQYNLSYPSNRGYFYFPPSFDDLSDGEVSKIGKTGFYSFSRPSTPVPSSPPSLNGTPANSLDSTSDTASTKSSSGSSEDSSWKKEEIVGDLLADVTSGLNQAKDSEAAQEKDQSDDSTADGDTDSITTLTDAPRSLKSYLGDLPSLSSDDTSSDGSFERVSHSDAKDSSDSSRSWEKIPPTPKDQEDLPMSIEEKPWDLRESGRDDSESSDEFRALFKDSKTPRNESFYGSTM